MEQPSTKDKGFDNKLNDVIILLNEWSMAGKIYNADIKFHINGFKVRDTRVDLGYKHFYTTSQEAERLNSEKKEG